MVTIELCYLSNLYTKTYQFVHMTPRNLKNAQNGSYLSSSFRSNLKHVKACFFWMNFKNLKGPNFKINRAFLEFGSKLKQGVWNFKAIFPSQNFPKIFANWKNERFNDKSGKISIYSNVKWIVITVYHLIVRLSQLKFVHSIKILLFKIVILQTQLWY